MIGREVYERLRGLYTLDPEDFVAPRLRGVGLFEFIVAVMLSQNTSDRNAWKAYTRLKSTIGDMEPENILGLGVEELAELIRPAGMHYQRAEKIIMLARAYTEREIEPYVRSLVEKGKIEEARRELIRLPGVGPKTADVVLLMWFNAPTFPVDTHITRITMRMGYVEKRDYEEIRRFWMNNTPVELYLPLHLLLIEHGRETCRARSPLCNSCSIRDLCLYGRGIDSSRRTR